MANRFPLIVDTSDSNKIKELPSGDNLQLTDNNIIGVGNITSSGTITANSMSTTSLTVSGTAIASVATSGNYLDLSNRPTALSAFSNDENFLSPGANVSVFTNDAGYLSTVAFADLTSTPNTLAGYGITTSTDSIVSAANSAIQPGDNVSTLANDAGYVTTAQLTDGSLSVEITNTGDLQGSVFGVDSTILVDGILSSINLDGTVRGNIIPHTDGLYNIGSASYTFNQVRANTFYGDGSNLTGVSYVGNFTLSASTITTDDSSSITIVPAVVMNSDLTVENDLTVNGDINTTSTGTPEVFSESDIYLTATDRVIVSQSPLQMASFTTSERDALTSANGDMIYNTTTNKFQGYANGSWVDLH